MKRIAFTAALLAMALATAARAQTPPLPAQPTARESDRFLDDLSRRTFAWFWDKADPDTGLVPNRAPSKPLGVSIGGMGFALTAWGIGAERGYISRKQAVAITLKNLRILSRAPQGEALEGTGGNHGFFYHYLDPKTGTRLGTPELSTIDTALFAMGALFAQSYFNRATPDETEIRKLAEGLVTRIDWRWTLRDATRAVTMGYRPEKGGWGKAQWDGYNEGTVIYMLALGSPAHALAKDSWTRGWGSTLDNDWGTLYGQTHLTFPPLFGHQYSHSWIDFRGIQDDYIRAKGIDYFENSRRATLAQYAYAQANPGKWTGYGGNIWGWTASDGPGSFKLTVNGVERAFKGYAARGIGLHRITDDGTIAPTAAGGSVAFAPEVAIPALMEMKQRYGRYIYNRYGFLDSFNMTFPSGGPVPQRGTVYPGFGWVDGDQLAIDQGAMLLMVENHRSGLIWKVMRRNPYVRRGLENMGFTGGWLKR